MILPAGAALLALPRLPLSAEDVEFVRHLVVLVLIAAIAWTVVRLISALEEVVEQKYRVDAKDNFSARRVQTQVGVLQRVTVPGESDRGRSHRSDPADPHR